MTELLVPLFVSVKVWSIQEPPSVLPASIIPLSMGIDPSEGPYIGGIVGKEAEAPRDEDARAPAVTRHRLDPRTVLRKYGTRH